MVPLSCAAPILDALLSQGLGGLEVVESLPVDHLYNYPADFDLGRMRGELAVHDPVAKRDGRAPVVGRIGLRFALLSEEPEALQIEEDEALGTAELRGDLRGRKALIDVQRGYFAGVEGANWRMKMNRFGEIGWVRSGYCMVHHLSRYSNHVRVPFLVSGA